MSGPPGPSAPKTKPKRKSSGQIVGGATTSGGVLHTFLWQSASGMQDLGTLGGVESYAWAINDHGQVAGDADTPSSGTHAFVWQTGIGMQDIGAFPGGGNSIADAINNHEQVAGVAETAGSTGRKIELPRGLYAAPHRLIRGQLRGRLYHSSHLLSQCWKRGALRCPANGRDRRF